MGNLVVNAGSISLDTDNAITVVSVAASGQFASSYTLGGSVSVNTVTATTRADMAHLTASVDNDITLDADEAIVVVSVAGAIQVSLNRSDDEDENDDGKSAAVGASIGLNVIDGDAGATIYGSDITYGGDVSLTANAASSLWHFLFPAAWPMPKDPWGWPLPVPHP